MKAISRRTRRPTPAGECCGKVFYTQDGWTAHLKRHKEEKNAQERIRSNRPLHPCLGGKSPYSEFLPL